MKRGIPMGKNKMKSKLKEIKLIVQMYELIMKPVHMCANKLKAFNRRFAKTRFSYGQCNPDKVFHIIKSDAANCGIFSLIFTSVFPYLEISEKKKYIPIVDYKNTAFFPMIQDEEDYGKDNPWEYYFEQPGGLYTLDEVYRSAKVEIGSPDKYGFKLTDWNCMMPMPPEKLMYWNRIVSKYIRPTKELSERINDEKNKLSFGQVKIMGVSIRAGYRRLALLNVDIIKEHPQAETCEYYIEIIQKKMDEWGYNRFFLACDDREYVTKIDKYFGKGCCHMDRKYSHMFINDIPVPYDNIDEFRSEYKGCTTRERTIEYIAETYLLASCESLYSTINGGAEFAYIVNGGKYKNLEVYSEGFY